MPWVHDEQAGWHYVRKKEKRESGTRRIIIEPNPPKTTEGQASPVDVPREVLGSEGSDAGGNAGSDPFPRGDGMAPGLGTWTLPETGEGCDPLPPTEERRPPEGDAPAPRVRTAGDGLGKLRKGERYTK